MDVAGADADAAFLVARYVDRASGGYSVTLGEELKPYGLSQPVFSLIAGMCAACSEVLAGSDYLKTLNADGEAIPGIEHTNIITKYDELVTPYTSGIMRDGGTNIVLQDVCSFGTFSTSTRHIRQLASGFNFGW